MLFSDDMIQKATISLHTVSFFCRKMMNGSDVRDKYVIINQIVF